jgi:hypothetical protein
MAARRTLAQQESRALRHLHRAHGRIPRCAPLRDWPAGPLQPDEPQLPDAGERNGKRREQAA